MRLSVIRHVIVDLQTGMAHMLELSSMFELSQKECSTLRLYYVVLHMPCNYL